MYMASAGDEKKVETAKSIIGAALIGLAIAVAAPTFLQTIVTIFSSGTMEVAAAPDLTGIVGRVLTFLLSVVGGLAIIGLITGGIMYLTAYGDEERIEKAKKILVNSIIGIVVCLGSLLVVNQVTNFFHK